MSIKDTFLYKLSKKNKLLFFGTLGYLLVCFITILQSFQITPFYNWSMYSGAVTKAESYSFTEIYCDNRLLNQPHTYNDYRKMMITYTSNEFLRMTDTNNKRTTYDRLNSTLTGLGLDGQYVVERLTVNDSLLLEYPAWLKRYIKKNLVSNFDSLRLYNVTVRYDTNANIQLLQRKLIFTK